MADLKKTIIDPLWDSNPLTIQILGICSSLAVTGKCMPAVTMAAGVTLVTAFANLSISSLRNYIPSKVKIIIQLVVVAVLVIIADQFLRAYMYDVSLTLSVFVGLIITNCIVLGRIAAYAEANPPIPSFFDGLSNGLGYGLVLMVVATFREIFGSGTWFGMKVMPESYVLNGLLVLPSAAFFCIGALVWIQKTITPKLVEKKG